MSFFSPFSVVPSSVWWRRWFLQLICCLSLTDSLTVAFHLHTHTERQCVLFLLSFRSLSHSLSHSHSVSLVALSIRICIASAICAFEGFFFNNVNSFTEPACMCVQWVCVRFTRTLSHFLSLSLSLCLCLCLRVLPPVSHPLAPFPFPFHLNSREKEMIIGDKNHRTQMQRNASSLLFLLPYFLKRGEESAACVCVCGEEGLLSRTSHTTRMVHVSMGSVYVFFAVCANALAPHSSSLPLSWLEFCGEKKRGRKLFFWSFPLTGVVADKSCGKRLVLFSLRVCW